VFCLKNILYYILVLTYPRAFAIFIFINVSEIDLMMEVMRAYFINQEKYSYFILLHLDAAVFVGMFSLAATG
jgi:hypothetical protein